MAVEQASIPHIRVFRRDLAICQAGRPLRLPSQSVPLHLLFGLGGQVKTVHQCEYERQVRVRIRQRPEALGLEHDLVICVTERKTLST